LSTLNHQSLSPTLNKNTTLRGDKKGKNDNSLIFGMALQEQAMI